MTRTLLSLFALVVLIAPAGAGPYSGPTDTLHAIDPAIPADSPLFVAWADAIDASRTQFAPRGSAAINPAATNSLGDLDSGQIDAGAQPGFLTVTFPHAIRNGAGADFAVFENGFEFGAPNGLFAELAYVEVSTDGTNFARFPSISTNTAPVAGAQPFAGFDMSNVYNLAGKHAFDSFSGVFLGTPFDLDSLASDSLVVSGAVDLSDIRFVKLVDVPGSGDFLDSAGHAILDNWLSASPTGGFDFRLGVGSGVGVLHATPEPLAIGIAAIGAICLAFLRKGLC